MEAPLHLRDADAAAYVASLGLPGIVDLHVHFMPERVQAKVWAHFDRLDPPWPILYRGGEAERLATLAVLGVRHHTALAYAHRPGMAAWLNAHTLGLAAANAAVVPSFTFYPEPGVEDQVGRALATGGAVAKVHLQVGKFHAVDPLLDPVWAELARRRVPVVLHAGAVPDGSGGEEFCGAGKVARLRRGRGHRADPALILGLPTRPAWKIAGTAGAGPAGAPTTPEATMRYRVTWNVEVEADDEAAARGAARQYLLDNEDEALSKVVALEEGSTPRDVPKVDAG
jgi:hypothetical protein